MKLGYTGRSPKYNLYNTLQRILPFGQHWISFILSTRIVHTNDKNTTANMAIT